MKNKWLLLTAVFQLLVGASGTIAFFILAFHGEPLGRWVVTLLLSVAFAGMGIQGIIQYRSEQ